MTTRLPFSSSVKVSITNLFHLECGFHIITEILSITRFKTSAVQAIETNRVYKEHLPYAMRHAERSRQCADRTQVSYTDINRIGMIDRPKKGEMETTRARVWQKF